jgi:cobalt/nickel transport system permease protein
LHIPDGFIAPTVYLPAWGMAAGLWSWCLRDAGRLLAVELIPRLSVATAAAFVLTLITLPLPGGTSVHLSFAGLLTLIFGWRLAFLSLSLVFGMQAFLLGDGGVSVLAINILVVAGVGGLCAKAAFASLKKLNARVALFTAGWISVVIPAALLAVVLGLQPHLAHAADGTPRFFPFGLKVTLPALILPHMLLGILEGTLTVLGWRILRGRDEGQDHA